MQSQGIKPDVATHNALISACEKGHYPPEAMQPCEDSPHQGIKPDIVTCSALISACEKG